MKLTKTEAALLTAHLGRSLSIDESVICKGLMDGGMLLSSINDGLLSELSLVVHWASVERAKLLGG